jgi:hypothetical protein
MGLGDDAGAVVDPDGAAMRRAAARSATPTMATAAPRPTKRPESPSRNGAA